VRDARREFAEIARLMMGGRPTPPQRRRGHFSRTECVTYLAQCGGDPAGSHGDQHLSAGGTDRHRRVVSPGSILLGEADQLELAGCCSFPVGRIFGTITSRRLQVVSAGSVPKEP
jgi:hypothetical protein